MIRTITTTTLALALMGATALNAFTIYESEDNSFIQSLVSTGRLQYDYSYFDEDDAGSQDETKWRRARAGFKAKLFNKVTLHAEMDMDLENHDPIYNGLTDANISWSINDAWKIKVGKQSAGFTLDGRTSSKKLIAIERSKLNENVWFTREYFTGVTLSGSKGKWKYNYGIFSNDASKDFENVGDEKYFILIGGSYDFGKDLNVDHAIVQVDFVHNRESGNVGTKKLENVLSVSGQYDNGAIHLWGDISYGKAFDGGDIFGIEIMPFYDINETFQVVGRYTYVDGDSNSLGLGRYEKDLVSGKGDSLQEFYVGLNTYFKGHKLKWQNGIQYTEMKDAANDGGEYSGIGFTSAIRFSW
jgi:phosphate-selective porin OprO/OprP